MFDVRSSQSKRRIALQVAVELLEERQRSGMYTKTEIAQMAIRDPQVAKAMQELRDEAQQIERLGYQYRDLAEILRVISKTESAE